MWSRGYFDLSVCFCKNKCIIREGTFFALNASFEVSQRFSCDARLDSQLSSMQLGWNLTEAVFIILIVIKLS
jgi:hypothetical protein